MTTFLFVLANKASKHIAIQVIQFWRTKDIILELEMKTWIVLEIPNPLCNRSYYEQLSCEGRVPCNPVLAIIIIDFKVENKINYKCSFPSTNQQQQ